MSVLVTGASGFLGRALVARLAADGVADVRLLLRPDRSDTALDALVAEQAARGWRIVRCGFDDPAALRAALDGVHTVHHLAAALRGGPAAIARGTLETSLRLLQAIAALPRPPRVLLVGSLGVHDTRALRDGDTLDESTPLDPHPQWRDAYTHAKCEQERWFREAHRRCGIPLAIARPGVIWGPGHAAPGDRVGLRLPGGLLLAPGLRCRIPLTFVDNCAAALAVVAARAAFAGEAYTVVDADPPRGRDWLAALRRGGLATRALPCPPALARALFTAWGMARRYSRGRLPLLLTPHQAHSAWKDLHYASALSALGWVQPVPFEEALRRTFGART